MKYKSNRNAVYSCKYHDALTRTGIIAEIIGNMMGPVMNMFSNLSFIIVAVFGARFVLSGSISVGVISAFIIYSKQFSRPINELSQLYGQIQTAIAGAERIFAILDQPGEDPEGAELPQPVRGVIEFKHVDFSYVPGTKIISDFNLKIESGRKIALVGSTGSGKTTIINLLMRFYETDSGEITLDGVNIRDLSLRSLRDSIGIVLQDTVLFPDTVGANLSYARPSATREEMDAAARASNCDSVVASLPRAMTPIWPPPAPTSPRASVSCWPLGVPSCPIPTSSSWTRPPPVWTPARKSTSRTPCIP